MEKPVLSPHHLPKVIWPSATEREFGDCVDFDDLSVKIGREARE